MGSLETVLLTSFGCAIGKTGGKVQTMKKKDLKATIAEKTAEIKSKQAELDNFELDPDECEKEYQEMINETTETIQIGYCKFDPADVLKEMDETAYRCGLNDYVDSIDRTVTEGYKELEEALEELTDELTDLENELEEMD